MLSPNDAPQLAVATDHISPLIGRLYRMPGTVLPENLDAKTIRDLVAEGVLFPSATNVISVKSSPFLIPWAARSAAASAVDMILSKPNSIVENVRRNRFGAIDYFKEESTRIRDASATQGSKVHLAAWQLGSGAEKVDFILTETESLMVDSYKKWLDVMQPEFLHLEVTGFGATDSGAQFGCTTDFIAQIGGKTVIGDYKCVTNSTAILLSSGRTVEAAKLAEGDRVVSWTREKGLHVSPVSYVGDNGVHPIIRIETTTGHLLETTLNHPYLSSRNTSNLGWVKAEDLRVGDELYVAMGWNHSPQRTSQKWDAPQGVNPYVVGLLWALRNYSDSAWSESPLHTIPASAGEGLRHELHHLGYHFAKSGQLNTSRGLGKMARKSKSEVEDMYPYFDMEEIPPMVAEGDRLVISGFLAGVREAFANRTVDSQQVYIAFSNSKALDSLQQLLLNDGQPAQIREAKQGQKFLTVPFETPDTIYAHGPTVSRVRNITMLEPQPTVAIEVEGSHTHITGGLITHNTNRSGLHSGVALQLAANSRMHHITPDNVHLQAMPEIDEAVAVHLTTSKAETRRVDISEKTWEAFANLREVWDFHAFDGGRKTENDVLQDRITAPGDI